MTIFSKIIKGDIPSHKIAENEDFYAFLDIAPLSKGHTLVVPKLEIDYIFDLDSKTYEGLFNFVKNLAPAIKRATNCKRIGIAVIGLDVPHCHVHLVPLNEANDINFAKEKLKLSTEEFLEIQKSITACL